MSLPIDDSYIDSIIKANQGVHPDPNKTSGLGLRELFKRLRDSLGGVPLTALPAGGANYAKLLYWSEFPGTVVKLDKYSRPLNAFKNYNIDGLDYANSITDSQYTIKNYISRVPQLKGYVYQPIWYMTTAGALKDTTTIYPALGAIWQNLSPINNSDPTPGLNQWYVKGLIPFASNPAQQAVKFDFSTLLGGSPSDDDMISLGRYISDLGIEFCLDPWFIGINRDVVAPGAPTNPQDWRGYAVSDEADIVINPAGLHAHTFTSGPHAGQTLNSNNYLITNFDAFLTSYYDFMIYYPQLMFDNAVDLKRYYIGSEYAAISATSNEVNRRKWINTLIRVDQYYKSLFPDGVSVYAANWQGELKNPSYSKWTLDELWASGIDRLGIDFYPPIGDTALDHTAPDEGYISQNLVNGEAADINFTNADYATQQKLTTTLRKGKQGLTSSPILSNVGDKNIASILNKYHYNAGLKPDGTFYGFSDPVPAQPTLLPGSDITKAFTGTVAITKFDGNDLFPVYNYRPLPYGKSQLEAVDAPNTDLCYVDLTNTVAAFRYNYPNFDEDNIKSFRMRFTTGPSATPAINTIASLQGRINVLIDLANGNKIKVNFNLTAGGVGSYTSPVIWAANTVFDIAFTFEGNIVNFLINGVAGQVALSSLPITAWSQSTRGTANTITLLGAFNGNTPLGGHLSYFEIRESRFGYACHFEEGYALGTRTCYQPMKGWITETGVASIDGSNVQTNAVPYAVTTFLKSARALDIPNQYPFVGDADFWNTLASNNVFVEELYGPYGSSFSLDEVGQSVTITKLVQFLQGRNFEDITVYGFDLRPPEVYKYINGAQPYFIDSPNYGLGQNLTGKLAGGFNPHDGTNILQRLTPAKPVALIGNGAPVYDISYSNGEVGTGTAGHIGNSMANVSLLNSGTIAAGTFTQLTNGIQFDEPSKLKLKPDAGDIVPLPFSTKTEPAAYSVTGNTYAIWMEGSVFANDGVNQINASLMQLAPSTGIFKKTSSSQYTMKSAIQVNTTSSITPNMVGIGITGKDIPYYVSTSYLLVCLDTTSPNHGKLVIKTIRGGGGGIDYQTNGDDDVISNDIFTALDLNLDFNFTYQRDIYTYTWTVEHNGQIVSLHQPGAWQGGGKIGTPSVLNLGGSYIVKSFTLSVDIAKNAAMLNPGASIDEGNQTDLFRFMPPGSCAFYAEGGSRPFDILPSSGGTDEWKFFNSVAYASWDYMANGLNWSGSQRPSDFLSNASAYPYHYEVEDILLADSTVRRGDKSHMIEIINKLCTLPGIKKVFIKTFTPYNKGIIGSDNIGGREYSEWGHWYWGPDGTAYTSGTNPTPYPEFSHKDKIIFIDNFTSMADLNPEHPIAGSVQGPYEGDPRYVQPVQPLPQYDQTEDSLLDFLGGRGHIYGTSLDLLHFNGPGNLLKTANELADMRKYLLAVRDGLADPVTIEKFAPPKVSFVISDTGFILNWPRQVKRQDGTLMPDIPITYQITINGGDLGTTPGRNDGLLYVNHIVEVVNTGTAATGNTYTFNGNGSDITIHTRYTFSIKALASGNVTSGGINYSFAESPANNYLRKTTGDVITNPIMNAYTTNMAANPAGAGSISQNDSDALRNLLLGLSQAGLLSGVVYFNPAIGNNVGSASTNVIFQGSNKYMTGDLTYTHADGLAPHTGAITMGFDLSGYDKQNFTVGHFISANTAVSNNVLVGDTTNFGISHFAAIEAATTFQGFEGSVAHPFNAVNNVKGNHVLTFNGGTFPSILWHFNGKLLEFGAPAAAGTFPATPLFINAAGCSSNIFFNRALSETEVGTLNSLINVFNAAIGRVNVSNLDHYIFEGDDNTVSYSGLGTTYTPKYTTRVFNALGATTEDTRIAEPAQQGMTAQYALLEANGDSHGYNTRSFNAASRNVFVYSLGSYDFFYSTTLTAADLYTNYIVPYLQKRIAAGYVVLIETITNHITYGGSPFFDNYNTQAPILNGLIRANSGGLAYTVIDTAALPSYADTNNTTYFIDGLHPTPANAQLRADLVAAAILAHRGPVPAPPGGGIGIPPGGI